MSVKRLKSLYHFSMVWAALSENEEVWNIPCWPWLTVPCWVPLQKKKKCFFQITDVLESWKQESHNVTWKCLSAKVPTSVPKEGRRASGQFCRRSQGRCSSVKCGLLHSRTTGPILAGVWLWHAVVLLAHSHVFHGGWPIVLFGARMDPDSGDSDLSASGLMSILIQSH